MPPKKAVEPIPGLDLLDAAKLSSDFKRFRSDTLYFMNFVRYKPTDGKGTPGKRILAVTPLALFVCTADGVLDRAVHLENVTGVVRHVREEKQFFSRVNVVDLCLRVPSEVDIVITVEHEGKRNEEVAQGFVSLLKTAAEFKGRASGLAFTVEEKTDGSLEDTVQARAPATYYSPQEVIAMNAARQWLLDRTQSATTETVELQQALVSLKSRVAATKAELSRVEGNVGTDLVDLEKRRADVSRRAQLVSRREAELEVSIMKGRDALAAVEAQLQEERENYDALLAAETASENSAELKRLDELDVLRQKRAQKELDQATARLERLQTELATPPAYEGPEGLVQRALEMEATLLKAAGRWDKELGTVNKLERIFEAEAKELQLLNDQAATFLENRRELLGEHEAFHTQLEKEREEKELKEREEQEQRARAQEEAQQQAHAQATAAAAAAAAAPAPPQGDGLLSDDDLLGGGPAPEAAPPAPAAGGDVLSDDDLLGGPGPADAPAPAAAPAPDAASGDPLGNDSFLGDAAPAAPAAASGDDDLI